MKRAEVIDGLERNWREEKRLIDEKSRNNRRTEAERVTRTAETIDRLVRNWREEKLFIDKKSRTIIGLKQLRQRTRANQKRSD